MSSPQARRGQTQRGQTQRSQAQRGKGRPLPPGNSLYTPDASDARRQVERSSAKPLLLLHQLPVWLIPVVMVGLLVAGLAVKGWVGAVALVLVAGVLSWLAAVSWPRLAASGRLMRVTTIAFVLVVAVIQATR